MSIDVYWHLPILQSGFRELWPYGPGSGAFQPSLGIGLDASIRKTTPILAPVDGRLVVVPTSLLTCAVLLLPDPAVMKAFVHDATIADEEVPGEGIRVARVFRFTRTAANRPLLWIAHCKRPGAEPVASGVRFDVIEP